MLRNNLFEEILIKPATDGADCLCIVSGYATATMTLHHVQTLRDMKQDIKIKLIIGMTPADGISQSNHNALKHLMERELSLNFECSYLTNSPQVHSKVYAWLKDEEPIHGFLGSANYTQRFSPV